MTVRISPDQIGPLGGAVAGVAVEATRAWQQAAFALAGVGLGGIGVAVPVLFGSHARGSTPELIFLAAFAVAAGLSLSFVTRDRAGTLVTINPAVCFTFALMLSWGVVAAIGAHLASVAALSWRWRLPPRRVLPQIVQVVGAFLLSWGVLLLDGNPGPRGREWTSFHDIGIVAAASAAWLVAYTALAYLSGWVTSHRRNRAAPTPTGNGLLFNAALVVLSPVVAVSGENNVGLSALLLLPLYAVQRMARLAVERERADRVDPLTLLANRTALRETFDRSTARSRAGPGPLVLVLVNLDRFKYLNDSLGYELGDQILVSVAQRLRGIHDGGVTVARLSADEFAVLARVPEMATAEALASKTVAAVREPVRLSGLLMEITASVGLAAHDDPGDDFVAVMRNADSAMQEAKRRGNHVVVFHGQPRYSSVEGVKLLSDFREALNAGESGVALHYQPQLSLATRTIEGLEALLRWTHPVHGQIDASTILGLAEQTTVMNLLTGRVIADVTGQVARWREQGLTSRVAINISARDLYSESIVAQLAERLSYHQLPPHLFQVEVTESTLTTDPVRARATLRQIADLGIDISLDDFGTGFSSLQQIRGTQLAEIKIDQSFVKGMTHNRDDAAIVASTINLAHSLGLRTVAEGVEDEATLVRLTELGCTLAQGWHISRPVPADRVASLIANPGAA